MLNDVTDLEIMEITMASKNSVGELTHIIWTSLRKLVQPQSTSMFSASSVRAIILTYIHNDRHDLSERFWGAQIRGHVWQKVTRGNSRNTLGQIKLCEGGHARTGLCTCEQIVNASSTCGRNARSKHLHALTAGPLDFALRWWKETTYCMENNCPKLQIATDRHP